MIKLKDLLKEEFIGMYDSYEVFKNPKSIKRMKPELRGISFPTGDLFVIDDAMNSIHVHFGRWLNQHGYKINIDMTIKNLFGNIKKGYIDWQRKDSADYFYLSESTTFKDDEEENEYMPYLIKYSKKVKSKNPKYNFILKSIWYK
jgi:hypothetical protein